MQHFQFRGLKPEAILQDGVYVFRGDFAVPLASAWVDVRKSSELAAAGNTQAALILARQAVSLAPNATRTQLHLADVLAGQGGWKEALAYYRLAQHWLQANRPELEQDELAQPVRRGMAAAAAHQP